MFTSFHRKSVHVKPNTNTKVGKVVYDLFEIKHFFLTFSICYASYTIAKDAENDFSELRLDHEKLTF